MLLEGRAEAGDAIPRLGGCIVDGRILEGFPLLSEGAHSVPGEQRAGQEQARIHALMLSTAAAAARLRSAAGRDAKLAHGRFLKLADAFAGNILALADGLEGLGFTAQAVAEANNLAFALREEAEQLVQEY